jgi:hypothetical protein
MFISSGPPDAARIFGKAFAEHLEVARCLEAR